MNVYIACQFGFVTSALAAKLFAQASEGRLLCTITHGTIQDIPEEVDLIIYQDGATTVAHPTARVRSVRKLLSLEEYRLLVEEWMDEHET
ncbi:hypothetical protein [Exiguobacterium algae]|uniref:hypothetical protein n=1 Tax=Exiguobacterium algae TaxID=2751250 RepID=UPI001BE529F1|nr:hypothetical protein [Exiguobacterium algae]